MSDKSKDPIQIIRRKSLSPFSATQILAPQERKKWGIYESLNYAIKTVRDFGLESLPFEVPMILRWPILIIYIFLLFAIFIALFYPPYYAAVNQVYLAPADSTTQGRCSSISQTNTGIYLGTMNGSWEGQEGFSYHEAAFYLDVANYGISISEYGSTMENVYSYLTSLGSKMVNNSLAQNLVIHMSAVYPMVQGSVAQRFHLIGDPVYVLNRLYLSGGIGSPEGICSAKPTVKFDRSTGRVSQTYVIQEFLSDPLCYEKVVPWIYGYDNLTESSTFEISIDVHQMITAVAINYGYLSIDNLVLIPGNTRIVSFGGVNFTANRYYDPKYPGMDPIFCGKVVLLKHSRCVVNNYYGWVVPFFQHLGTGVHFETARPCSCNGSSVDPRYNDPYFACNMFNLAYGFLLWPKTIDYLPMLQFQEKLRRDYTYLDHSIYDAMVFSIPAFKNTVGSDFFDTSKRLKAFDFCKTAGGYCSMVIFYSYDSDVQKDFRISEEYAQLFKGACRDSLSLSKDTFNKLVEYPFSPLEQQYKQCLPYASGIAVTTFGSTLGNMGVFIGPVIIFIFLLVFIYKRTSFHKPHIYHSYERRERDEALKALAVALLMVRDGTYSNGKLNNPDDSKGNQFIDLGSSSSDAQFQIKIDSPDDLQESTKLDIHISTNSSQNADSPDAANLGLTSEPCKLPNRLLIEEIVQELKDHAKEAAVLDIPITVRTSFYLRQ